MKYTALLFVIVLIVLSGCTTGSIQNTNVEKDTSSVVHLREATFEIKDMTCISCAQGVEYQWKKLDGVIDARVSYEKGTGIVTYDGDKLNGDTIAQASTVYPAKVITDELK